MTAFEYSRPLATANRLIARYGQTGALTKVGSPTGPSYDPTPGQPETCEARFVVTDYTSREIDGSRILAIDRKALVAPEGLTFAPEPGVLLVESDGSTLTVISVERLRPAETTLLWTLQVRR